jgi:hypothetical protein
MSRRGGGQSSRLLQHVGLAHRMAQASQPFSAAASERIAQAIQRADTKWRVGHGEVEPGRAQLPAPVAEPGAIELEPDGEEEGRGVYLAIAAQEKRNEEERGDRNAEDVAAGKMRVCGIANRGRRAA